MDYRTGERPEVPDIHDLVEEICQRLGLKSSYVYKLELEPGRATVFAFKGVDGLCEGSKFVIKDEASPLYGEAALEPPLTFPVRA